MRASRVSAHLLLLAALPALAGRGWWCADGEVVSVTSDPVTGPEFLPADTVVVAAVGQDALLNCRVRSLADKAVSWVRSRDLQILSHAGAVFTADARVSVRVAAAGAGASEHALRIRRLRVADTGRYECQLNTDPKMSLFYNLTVLDEAVPRAVIRAGAGAVRGARGGEVRLSCEARYEPAPRALPLPPLDIAWTKDGASLDQRSGGGGVSRDTERWGWRAVSRLTLAGVTAGDAGVYACAVVTHTAPDPLATPATPAVDYVHLYVDAESQMEAMQRDQSAESGARAPSAPPPAMTAIQCASLIVLLHRLLHQ